MAGVNLDDEVPLDHYPQYDEMCLSCLVMDYRLSSNKPEIIAASKRY